MFASLCANNSFFCPSDSCKGGRVVYVCLPEGYLCVPSGETDIDPHSLWLHLGGIASELVKFALFV